ncbi:hypothetical protein DW266_15800 [Blautia sp. AM22-22LB]|nr:hypothetical protein DW177_15315 [Blautia sp. AM16-16B]RHN98163.1 hypothetical protein DW266_15800 [Blautia sp. AM22-22LB]RHS48432.1 hypothetical protein DW962_14925 [Blautia sp. AM46-5]RHS54830.1 hypothetical protein DW961_14905 [Blautia sp. AM46-3MH]
MRKFLTILLSGILILAQGVITFAADEIEDEQQYEMVENTDWLPGEMSENTDISTCTLYIADIYTSIVKVSSTQVSIYAETVCSQKVKSIKVIYILQKWNGSKWVDIVSRTATAYDVSSTHKSYTISGLGTGKYRCKASAVATGYNGYAEGLAGYSGSISL